MSADRRTTLLPLAALLVLVLLEPGVGRAQAPAPVREIAKAGFGDPANSYAWSMAWFRGKLYVGTARSQLCVERATIEFYWPGLGYSTRPGLDLTCAPDPYDLRLRAEIWQFDPGTRRWTRVYRSPADVANPRAPGKRIARDIGFRGMVVHRERNGRRALYVAGVTADEYIPELAPAHPPRILRSTDGRSFVPLRGAPGTIHTATGPLRPIGYRAMASYSRRLFVTASGGLTGDGVILEVKHPSGRAPRFVQVSPRTLRVFELQVFNGHLYAGAGDMTSGYSVWRTDATGTPAFKPIVTGGAGRGGTIVSVISMHVYRGHLYVGASGWGSTLPQSELIRIDRAERWELVVGNARAAPDGATIDPISGFPDGFGNPFNSHFWRAQDHAGALYVGTNDWSWSLRGSPELDPRIKREFGFDLYATCDGRDWWPVTRDGFGHVADFGARTMESTSAGAFLGTANHADGTTVLRDTGASPCRRATAAAAPHGRARADVAPRRLLADPQACGTVLSWDRSRDAKRYRILRAEYRRVPGAWRVPAAARREFVPELPPSGTRAVGPGAGHDLSVPGDFQPIGTTTRPLFVDRRARRGTRYAYAVLAQPSPRGVDARSNEVLVPAERPAATFAEVREAIVRTAATPPPGNSDRLLGLAAGARTRWRRDDLAGSLRKLDRLARVARDERARAARHGRDDVEDGVSDVVLRLERRVRLAHAACRSRPRAHETT